MPPLAPNVMQGGSLLSRSEISSILLVVARHLFILQAHHIFSFLLHLVNLVCFCAVLTIPLYFHILMVEKEVIQICIYSLTLILCVYIMCPHQRYSCGMLYTCTFGIVDLVGCLSTCLTETKYNGQATFHVS